MQMKKRLRTEATLILLILLPLLSGCWDSHELNKYAIVAGIGFDIDPQTGLNTMTYQSIVPSQVKNPSGGLGGGETKGSGPFPAVQNDYGTGISPHEAVSRCTLHSSRMLFYPHAQIYIFGNELARKGVNLAIDTIARIVASRPNVPIAIAENNASDILILRDGMDNIPASGVASSIKLSADVFSKFPAITFLEFCNRLMSKSTAPIAPILGFHEEIGQDGIKIKKVTITGTAVFRGEKMIGELNEQESRGLLWVINRIKKGYVIIPETNTAL
ncbi:MAG: Ger(x)C family spore germination protein, partial [Methylocystaceae bacterium]